MMNSQKQSSERLPLHLNSPSGMSILVNTNGSIRRMDYHNIIINLFPGAEIEGGPTNLYLRRHSSSLEAVPLLGPRSPSAFSTNTEGLNATGEWQELAFYLSLRLAQSAPAWFWHLDIKNTGSAPQTMDLIYAQDLGLADYWAVRINEYYSSHYVDHSPLSHPKHGTVIASRQNLSMAGKNPWTLIGAIGHCTGFSTDALQFYSLSARAGEPPVGLTKGLPGVRLQHEHSLVTLQEGPVTIEPGAKSMLGFFGWFEADHPAASSEEDLAFVERAMALPEAKQVIGDRAAISIRPAATLFSRSTLMQSMGLNRDEIEKIFGPGIREEEIVNGKLLSFFVGNYSHVALKEKELAVLRPHMHIIRTGSRLTPDEGSLTSTCCMAGVFHSMVTQGHVSINRLLSATHSYLGIFRSNGQRIFVENDGRWWLLDVPSAFEMTPQGCRWIYKHGDGLIEVKAEALTERNELTLSIKVLSGPPARFFISNHVAINGDDGSNEIPVQYAFNGEAVFFRPSKGTDLGRRFQEGGFRFAPLSGTIIEWVGGDEMLFTDGKSRKQPFVCIITAPNDYAEFRLTGHLISEPADHGSGPSEADFWAHLTSHIRFHPPASSRLSQDVSRLGEILPWFIHNSLVHCLAPRGTEQYTGGNWGTRDICQGPVELLLSLDHSGPVRDLLIQVFRNQNPDGDWPQWFMFFDRERNTRAADSHGDIVFWPILAMARYLSATEDRKLLEEVVPFFHPECDLNAEKESLWGHIERALAVIAGRVIPDTRLAAYGHGDWNDSLQPAQPAMREQLCSTWTVTLHYQVLLTLAESLRRLDMADHATRIEAIAAEVRNDFRRLLIVDEILPGYAYFLNKDQVEYLLHPSDRKTGVSYSLLPMIHAIISNLLTKDEAKKHLELIGAHLLGPDGARLFDRPMKYRGGPQHYFQRAESAAFFGREIGLMYTHAHLRYAEALAHYGDVDGFFLALRQANPIDICKLVSGAKPRQANCYYSSSDAAFRDRYQASAEYDRIRKGEVGLDGGWRIYSSGPGIATRLIIECFLGLCRQKTRLIIDPVIPKSLDGLRVDIEIADRMVEVQYHINSIGLGTASIQINGEEIPFSRILNPYRTGAAEILMDTVNQTFHGGMNHMEVFLG
ncbi:conserved hypothetical protein [uncultured Desulfobacterium sp.]|uniref:Glycosyl hydrolase 94 domain-containing protein n=1 Tax=uncultured Desulfobacterium sp. TaxID=201089 RepID=A0A445N2Y5_9BACT|nr:conserved hypothetical protein [uncultured Desulfobacterium sp.]